MFVGPKWFKKKTPESFAIFLCWSGQTNFMTLDAWSKFVCTKYTSADFNIVF